jgi:hypothetical protein
VGTSHYPRFNRQLSGASLCDSPFLFDHFVLKAHALTGYYKRQQHHHQQQQPYYNHTTTPTILQGQENNRKRYENDTTTNRSEDEHRPAAATFEEAFRDVQPRPNLEATLMARHPELQVEAEGMRRA